MPVIKEQTSLTPILDDIKQDRLRQAVLEIVKLPSPSPKAIGLIFDKFGVPYVDPVEVALSDEALEILETHLRFRVLYMANGALDTLENLMLVCEEPDIKLKAAAKIIDYGIVVSKRVLQNRRGTMTRMETFVRGVHAKVMEVGESSKPSKPSKPSELGER